jgi:hypothetical protein
MTTPAVASRRHRRERRTVLWMARTLHNYSQTIQAGVSGVWIPAQIRGVPGELAGDEGCERRRSASPSIVGFHSPNLATDRYRETLWAKMLDAAQEAL